MSPYEIVIIILIRPKSVSVYMHELQSLQTSSALEFMKVWQQKQIPSQIQTVTGLEHRRSPIQEQTQNLAF